MKRRCVGSFDVRSTTESISSYPAARLAKTLRFRARNTSSGRPWRSRWKKPAVHKVPVAGRTQGGYNTCEVIELAKECVRAGADGLLSVTPYYNKPMQEGLYKHYAALAKAVSGTPVVVYSVQSRTSVNVEPATLARLAAVDNIIGVKEASGNISQIANVIHDVPDDFIVLSGDDAMTIPVISLGGHGLISVVSNQIPRAMSDLTRAARQGDFETARTIQRQYMPVFRVNFIETNPIPVKWGMHLMGLIEPVYRLPLCEPSEASKQKSKNTGEIVAEGAAVASRH